MNSLQQKVEEKPTAPLMRGTGNVSALEPVVAESHSLSTAGPWVEAPSYSLEPETDAWSNSRQQCRFEVRLNGVILAPDNIAVGENSM